MHWISEKHAYNKQCGLWVFSVSVPQPSRKRSFLPQHPPHQNAHASVHECVRWSVLSAGPVITLTQLFNMASLRTAPKSARKRRGSILGNVCHTVKLLAYQMFHVISTKPLKIAPYAIEADSLLSAVVLSVVFSEELNLANQPSSMVKVVDHIRKHSMNFFFLWRYLLCGSF